MSNDNSSVICKDCGTDIAKHPFHSCAQHSDGKVLDLIDARRKRDEQEERRLEQNVIERWTGPTNESEPK